MRTMLFWGVLVVVLLLLTILEEFIPERYGRAIPVGMIIGITFLVGFRYNIGADYQSYISLYQIDKLPWILEPVYHWIVGISKAFGMNYQFVYVVYSILTSLFIWKSLRYYTKDDHQLTQGIFLYVVLLGGMSLSFSVIRQALAAAIFLWGSQFLVKRDWKRYFLTIAVLTLIHYSAVLLIVLYFIPLQKLNRKYWLGLFVFSLVITYFGLIKWGISQLDFFYATKYAIYLKLGSAAMGTGITYLFYMGVWLGIILLWKVDSIEDHWLRSLYGCYIILWIMFSFSDPMARVRHYFELFSIFVFIRFAEGFTERKRQLIFYGIIICYGVIFLNTMYKMSLLPDINIIYQFNFHLLR